MRHFYPSLTEAAADFGRTHQWLSQLAARGRLPTYPVEGHAQARGVFHFHVAEALRDSGGLAAHSCPCSLAGYEDGAERAREQAKQVLRHEKAQWQAADQERQGKIEHLDAQVKRLESQYQRNLETLAAEYRQELEKVKAEHQRKLERLREDAAPVRMDPEPEPVTVPKSAEPPSEPRPWVPPDSWVREGYPFAGNRRR